MKFQFLNLNPRIKSIKTCDTRDFPQKNNNMEKEKIQPEIDIINAKLEEYRDVIKLIDKLKKKNQNY